MNRIKCFFAKPTTIVRRYLRRYADGECPGKYSYHNAGVFSDEIEVPLPEGAYERDARLITGPPTESEKINFPFPAKCDSCDFIFPAEAAYQIYTERQYRNEETGELYAIGNLPPGAMYYGDWMLTENSNLHRGSDGHCLIVILPDGHPWIVDSRCNNCGLPDDNIHKCWVRHGAPPNITVDKNGITCPAGGGSIATSKYHGFLRNGYLEKC